MSQNIRVLFQFHSDFSGNVFPDQEIPSTEIIPTSDLKHPIIVYFTPSNLKSSRSYLPFLSTVTFMVTIVNFLFMDYFLRLTSGGLYNALSVQQMISSIPSAI